MKTILAAIALSASILPTDSPAGNSLLFSMAGSRNGSMPDFSITAGRSSESTRTVIYVDPDVYASTASLIATAGSRTSPKDEPSFTVTEFEDSRLKSEFHMTDKAVGGVIRKLVAAYQSKGETPPAIVPEIANSLP